MKKLILLVLASAAMAMGQAAPTTPPTVTLVAVLVAAPTLAQCAAAVPQSGASYFTVCAYGTAPNLGLAVSLNGSAFQPIGGGAVKTVNGKTPDTNGNVSLSATTTVNAPSATTALQ